MAVDYKHGISTSRDSDIAINAVAAARAQVAVGVAPVNLLDDPQSAVNTPVLLRSRSEARQYLGVNTDYEHYNLMHTILAAFQKIGVAPVVMINVLDPSNPKHVTAVAGTEYEVVKGTATVDVEGILLDTLVVSDASTTGEADTDYVAAFDTEGHVLIAVTEDGAFKESTSLTVAYTKLNPDGVTNMDIIGGVSEDGVRTGIELIDEIYSRFQIVPDILTAPGYSSNPAVAAALEAKAELAGDLTNAVALIDVETETTRKAEDVADAKNKLGTFARQDALLWPMTLMAGERIYSSAVVAAVLQREYTTNSGVPTSPDNKDVPIEGMVLSDGTEIHLTQKQVNNHLNANGIISFLYLGGWKCWGNNSAAYPDHKEPNNRFIKCVMVGNYLENRFKTEYLSAIGRDASYKLIESIVSNYNAELNALVPNYLAGAETIFQKDENPLAEILEGRFTFHTNFADYTPMEHIDHKYTWSSHILEQAFEGGE